MILTRMTPNSTSVLLIALIILALAVLPVSAVETQNAPIVLDVMPGRIYTAPVTLSLSNGEPDSSFALAVSGLGQSPFEGTYSPIDPAADRSPYTARPLITLDKNAVHLMPGEQAAVTATIVVPEDAPDGGRYAAILVYPIASETGRPASVPLAVVPVLLSIGGGKSIESGEITALEYTTEYGRPLQVATYFQNTGNHHISGVINRVTVTDRQGTVVARAITSPSRQPVIPRQEIRFGLVIEGSLPDMPCLVTSRIEQQDGALLAEQEELLPGRGELAESHGGDSSNPSGITVWRVSGFGIGLVLLAVLAGVAGRKRL